MCTLPGRDPRSHAELYLARESVKDPGQQALLAAAEHEAFAREFVKDGPAVAPAVVGLATPAYTAGKALARHPGLGAIPALAPAVAISKMLKLDKSRSGPSMVEVGSAFRGIADGLQMRYGDR